MDDIYRHCSFISLERVATNRFLLNGRALCCADALLHWIGWATTTIHGIVFGGL